MKNDGSREAEIDAFLENRMTDEQRRQFESELAADPDLAAALDEQRVERRAWAGFADPDIRRMWDEKHRANSVFVEKNSRFSGFQILKNWKIWMGVLAIVGLFFCFFQKEKPAQAAENQEIETPTDAPQPSIETPAEQPKDVEKQPSDAGKKDSLIFARQVEKFANERLEKYQKINLSSPDDPAAATLFEQAETLFLSPNFAEALPILEQPDSANLRNWRWLRGQVLFKMGKFARAADDFGWLARTRTASGRAGSFASEAAWNEVVCLARLPERQRTAAGFSEKLAAVQAGKSKFSEPAKDLEKLMRSEK